MSNNSDSLFITIPFTQSKIDSLGTNYISSFDLRNSTSNTATNVDIVNNYFFSSPNVIYTQINNFTSTTSNLFITVGILKSSNFVSTIAGLGTIKYISSFDLEKSVNTILTTQPFVADTDLASTVAGMGTSRYISTLNLQNIFIINPNSLTYSNYSMYNSLNSTIDNLGLLKYISSLDLVSTFFDISNNHVTSLLLASTIQGLGTINYISSLNLISTYIDISNNLINITNITSTLAGLDSNQKYISSFDIASNISYINTLLFTRSNMTSTIAGLGTLDYVSSLSLQSTVNNILASNVTYKRNLTSTVSGLGGNSINYISSLSLQSTVYYFTYLPILTYTLLSNTFNNLDTNQQYISSLDLVSTTSFFVNSLAYTSTIQNTVEYLAFTSKYISSLDLVSTFTDFSNNSLLVPLLISTVNNLGLANYVSSFDIISTVYNIQSNLVSLTNIASTVEGLGTSKYISSLSLQSSVYGFNNTPNLIFTSDIRSTVAGLGTTNYVSSFDLAYQTGLIRNNSNAVSIVNFNSSMVNLGSSGYISSLSYASTTRYLYNNIVLDSNITSTILGLNTLKYISTLDLQSTNNFFSSNYPINSNLTSTMIGLSFKYISSLDLASTLYYFNNPNTPYSVQSNFISTIAGLGTAGYIVSPDLQLSNLFLTDNYMLVRSNSSTLVGLGTAQYISSLDLQLTNSNLLLNYHRNINLNSTLAGLGTYNYISSLSLQSTNRYNLLNYVNNRNLASTINGLGTVRYISSLDLSKNLGNVVNTLIVVSNVQSTIDGLGTTRYISTLHLQSTVSNIFYQYELPANKYLNVNDIISTIDRLGNRGTAINSLSYISSLSLQSTVDSILRTGTISATPANLFSTVDGLSNIYIQSGFTLPPQTNISTLYGNISSVGVAATNAYSISNNLELDNYASDATDPNMVINDKTTSSAAKEFIIVIARGVDDYPATPYTLLYYSKNNATSLIACTLVAPYTWITQPSFGQPIVFNGSLFISVTLANNRIAILYSSDGITFNGQSNITFDGKSNSSTSFKNIDTYSIYMTYNPNTNTIQMVPGYTAGTSTEVTSVFLVDNTNVVGWYMVGNDFSKWYKILTPSGGINGIATNNSILAGYGFNGICQVFVFSSTTLIDDNTCIFSSLDGITLIYQTNNIPNLNIKTRSTSRPTAVTAQTIGIYNYIIVANYTSVLYSGTYNYARTIDGINWETLSPSRGTYSNFFYADGTGPLGIAPLALPKTNHIQRTPFGFNIPFGYTNTQSDSTTANSINQVLYISPTQDIDLFGNEVIKFKTSLPNYTELGLRQPSIFYINSNYFIMSFATQGSPAGFRLNKYFARTTDFITFSGVGASPFDNANSLSYMTGFATNYDTLAVSLQVSTLSIYAQNMSFRIPLIESDNVSNFPINYIHATKINLSSIINFNDALFIHGTRNSVDIGGILAIPSTIFLTPTTNLNINSNTSPYNYFSSLQTLEVNRTIRTTNNNPLKPRPGNWAGYSDQNVKTNIINADLERCYEITSSISLVHYSYNSSLQNVFNTNDTHMLGYIAQDVGTIFPKSVKSYILNTSSILSLDMTQIQMAHYGTTQYMISSIQQRSTLIETQFLEIQSLLGKYSTLVSLSQI